MSLLSNIAKKENLFLAWSLIKKNPRSYGIDQETIDSFKDELYKRITSINSLLRNNKYHFSSYRAHKLNKKGKKPRILQIPTVRDRVVQKAILNIIGTKFYPDFCTCSYGYIEGRKIPDAIYNILEYKKNNYFFVLEAAIEKFFDTVKKEKLFEMLISKFKKDRSIDKLLKDSLEAEVGNLEILSCQEIEFLNNHEIGIPQGGVLSPLFANIYLTHFDKKMLASNFRLVRYADDFIVLSKTKDEALKAYDLCKYILEKELEVKLHPLNNTPDAKTRVSDFKKGFRYLGIQFDLHNISPALISVNKFKQKVKELTNYNQVGVLLNNLIKLSGLIYGWGNAYRFCKNGKTQIIFSALDNFISERLNCMLKKLHFLSDNISQDQLRHLKIPRLTTILDRSN